MLTAAQIIAILMVLQSFGVSQSTLDAVNVALHPAQATTQAEAAPSAPTATVSAPAPTQGPSSASAPQPYIELVSIGYYKDAIGAPHYAAPIGTKTWDAADDGQFVAVGIVLHRADGTIDAGATMQASTTDPTQNVVMQGTSACDRNGLCYYPYHYLFRTPGAHTLEFIGGGADKTITLQAQ